MYVFQLPFIVRQIFIVADLDSECEFLIELTLHELDAPDKSWAIGISKLDCEWVHFLEVPSKSFPWELEIFSIVQVFCPEILKNHQLLVKR